MLENNKSYRIRTKIGVTEDSPVEDKYLTVKLTNDIDSIDIMSLKIKQENAYKFHAADYGVVVGRAIANGGFGVPNVKVSVFIAASDITVNDPIYNAIYPYQRPTSKNQDNIRYNLLPDTADDDCYQVVGTFPNKRLVLDDDNYMEIYDNYYKFTTRTNNAGDYMIFGIPTGGQILHFDTDLSDVGVLSQKPRDMIYKGYNEKQFENANQFKVDDNLANLPQIISQDDSVYVYPFWGDEDENIIGITRHDIDINYKFEPTCVFIGSVVSDTNTNHISKKCIPTSEMGLMEEMVTGRGTIEMIRKKQNGDVEQFNIQGTQLINEKGVWCYQIPMNLDYVMTDEYGNLVPSDDPTKGIATRTKVRFRVSMDDMENDSLNSFRTKVLVPNNPQNSRYEPDYVFGSFTEEESFRDLLWNNVYTVKSFIPRFQKGNGDVNRRFSGIKQCNYHGQNNPIPYNNMRINLSFQFVITCLLVRLLVWIVGVYNAFITALSNALSWLINSFVIKTAIEVTDWFNRGSTVVRILKSVLTAMFLPLRLFAAALAGIGQFFQRMVESMSCVYLDGSMCNTLEGPWYFAPNCGTKKTITSSPNYFVWRNMMGKIEGKKLSQIDFSSAKSKTGGGMEDKQSIDSSNADDMKDENNWIHYEYTTKEGEETVVCAATAQYIISRGVNYFLQCIEISLAMEYRVVQFDFYNDWINGLIYIPRWERSLRKKRKYLLFGKTRVEVRACNDTYKKRFLERKNNLTEQCAVSYKGKVSDNSIGTRVGCKDNRKYKCHKKAGRKQFRIFNDGGAVHEEPTATGLYAYYFKPCEYITNRNSVKNRKVNLFATDIVLLGSLVNCDLNGTPLFTNELVSTSYQIPSPLAQTDSTEEGNVYVGVTEKNNIVTDPLKQVNGLFDFADTVLNPKDDGSVTEVSGIDWGYTGPGQGEPKKTKTYTPGGHFLGISCVNAESSIKSCVNLKRICEVGVWQSQRQEVFNGYGNTSDGNEKVGTYVDIIPNGLIAKDEISDGNFRKIFSTMNANNLKTRINDSGFTVYDFLYMSPEGFGGEFAKYVRTNYNHPNPLENIDNYLAKQGSKNEDGEEWPNGGEDESQTLNLKPVRRSLDERDQDYMMFRLGLTKDTNSQLQTKYLGQDDYGYYMPVYNNSFYFYFGLIPGSTALDEFYKQFFAECKHTMTTEDLRLNVKMPYKSVCCSGNPCEDAFNAPVEISIFETGATLNSSTDYLRIYSTALPIKIVVDGDNMHTIYSDKDSAIKQTQGSIDKWAYIDVTGWTVDGKNAFNFSLGKHTIRIADSEGRSVTKLVEVTHQNIEICPRIEGVDFVDDKYVIEKTVNLINGQTQQNRDNLGGWFLFDWSESECDTGCTRPLFTYVSNPECGSGRTNCVEIGDSGLCMVFVGRSHIIQLGEWDGNIGDFEEFSGFEVFKGTMVSKGDRCAVYGGEEGRYDFYVLYRNGQDSTQSPILIQDGIYIGEPDAIDFDVFREVIESEEDSPVTYRNPIIKLWYRYPNEWFLHMYDEVNELNSNQKWYVRKMIYYVLNGLALDNNNNEIELNENFISERTIYINAYYPPTVGGVNCYVDDAIGSTFEKTTPSSGPELEEGQVIKEVKVRLSGTSLNDGEIFVPVRGRSNGDNFIFPILFKPYYYKAVIWEGYSVLKSLSSKDIIGGGLNITLGHVHGWIYNGIVYDGNEGQIFGPTILNDRIMIEASPIYMDNDFTFNRKTEIKYSSSGDTFTEPTNKLLISEGSPRNYESLYTPVEYSIETSTIGSSNMWEVGLTIDLTQPLPKASITVTFEDNGYQRINWAWANRKNIKKNENQLWEKLIEEPDFEEMALKVQFDKTGHTDTNVFSFEIDLPAPGSPRNLTERNMVSGGTLLVESLKHDDFQFSNIPSQSHLGYLASRCFVRNDIVLDYAYDSFTMENSASAFVTVSDACLEKNKINSNRANKELKDESIGLVKFYIDLPFAPNKKSKPRETNKKFRIDFARNIETVIIKIENAEYNLTDDFGYIFTPIGGRIMASVCEPSSENGIVYDRNSKVENDFTDALGERFGKNFKRGYLNVINATITLIATNLGDNGDNGNDTITSAKLIYNTQIKFINKEAPEEEE